MADSVGSQKAEYAYYSHGALYGMVSTRGSDTLLVTGYVRDSLGRITRLVEKVQGITHEAEFTYDTAGRLKTVTRDGALSATYSYDQNGNRLSRVGPSSSAAGTYDDQDRMLTYGGAGYAYGANGELRTKVEGTDTTQYTYDALGNLIQVLLPDGTDVEYVIDAQNRRIGKKVNGVLTTGWLYQGQLTPVAELDGAGNAVSRFVYATGINVPDYMVRGDSTYRLIRDHLGSVRLVVNTQSGTIAQRIDYDEFGVEIQNTNPGFQPFGFAGGLTEVSTGLVRFGFRDYDAAAGRWTAKDPVGFLGGSPNLYGYADLDPVNGADPTGLYKFRLGQVVTGLFSMGAGYGLLVVGAAVIGSPVLGAVVAAGALISIVGGAANAFAGTFDVGPRNIPQGPFELFGFLLDAAADPCKDPEAVGDAQKRGRFGDAVTRVASFGGQVKLGVSLPQRMARGAVEGIGARIRPTIDGLRRLPSLGGE